MFSEVAQEQILYDKIYQYLWVESDTSNPPKILIPETIIIVRSQPVQWYYSDKVTGQIKKKKRNKTCKNFIKEDWLKKTPKCDVVASLLHFCENLDLKQQEPNENLKTSNQIQVVYFDSKGFADYMDNDNIWLPFGILQRFIDPGDERNSQIQAIWSKQITLFTKRTNKRLLHSKRLNIYERCCTFEGPEYFSDATQVKDFQSQRISDQINTMIGHLDSISYGKLSILQGTFYFKVDKNANCFFLFCGNLKFSQQKKTQQPIAQNLLDQMKIPKSIDNIISIYTQRPVKLEKDVRCIRCDNMDKSYNYRPIPYLYLVEELEKNGNNLNPSQWPEILKQEMCKIKISAKVIIQPYSKEREKVQVNQEQYLNTITQMPITLEMIHNRLTPAVYQQIKDNFEFQQRTVKVCQNCFIDLVELHQRDQVKQTSDDYEFQGFMQRQQSKVPEKKFKCRLQFLNLRRYHSEQIHLKSNFQSEIGRKPSQAIKESIEREQKDQNLDQNSKKEGLRKKFIKRIRDLYQPKARTSDVPVVSPVDDNQFSIGRQMSTAEPGKRKTKYGVKSTEMFNLPSKTFDPHSPKSNIMDSNELMRPQSQGIYNPYIKYTLDVIRNRQR